MINEIIADYSKYQENIPHRYFPPESVNRLIAVNNYQYEVIGKSFQHRPIVKLSVGKGDFKIIFWAQMHGNESTASRAMFDFWKLLSTENVWVHKVLSEFTIDFIPQLNPDGAQVYTRRNAANIDINRDFIAMQSPEIQALQGLVNSENYNLLFNLHDQRTIFHPKGQKLPATLSFLAPATDVSDASPDNRKFAIQIIACMIQKLMGYIPNQIARFTHEYYPKATGDNFQRLGFPTILIECGHYPSDYKRNITRKYTFIAILAALDGIIQKNYQFIDPNIYHSIPQNEQKSYDIIYKGIMVKNEFNEMITDLGIQFEERLEDGKDEISWLAKIQEVGDLSDFFGHDIYHAENRLFLNGADNIPNLGDMANFTLGKWQILNGKKI